jgi:hypothetical protein
VRLTRFLPKCCGLDHGPQTKDHITLMFEKVYFLSISRSMQNEGKGIKMKK